MPDLNVPDLKVRVLSEDEVDGLDESSTGVPAPNTASGFAAEFSLPTVVPRRVAPLAVVTLVLAFIIPVAAIPLAHIVTRSLQHDGRRGRGVAHAAIVVGYLNILLMALVAVNLVVALFVSHP